MKSIVFFTFCIFLSAIALGQEVAFQFSKKELKWLSKNEISEQLLSQMDAREDSLFREALTLFRKSHRLGFISMNEIVAAPVACLIGFNMLENWLFYAPAGFTLIGAGIALVPVAGFTFLACRTKLRTSNGMLQVLKSTYENRLGNSGGGH